MSKSKSVEIYGAGTEEDVDNLWAEIGELYAKYPGIQINDFEYPSFVMAYGFCKWWLEQPCNRKTIEECHSTYSLKHRVESTRRQRHERSGYTEEEIAIGNLGYVPEVACICAILYLQKRSLYRLAHPTDFSEAQ